MDCLLECLEPPACRKDSVSSAFLSGLAAVAADEHGHWCMVMKASVMLSRIISLILGPLKSLSNRLQKLIEAVLTSHLAL